MKTKYILYFIVFILPGRLAFTQSAGTLHGYLSVTPDFAKTPRQSYLSITPDFTNATLNEGYGNIPFTVRNSSTENIVFLYDSTVGIPLLTVDDKGKIVSVARFKDPDAGGGFYSGRGPMPVILKPGQSGTYASHFFMDTLAFAAARNKKIFSEIRSCTMPSKQKFVSYSTPFAVPSELSKPPWIDLGKKDFFSVTVDPTKPEIDQSYAFIMVPIKITNTTDQTYIAFAERVSFYVVNEDSKNKGPDLWETIKADHPVLKPGESVSAGGRSYFRMQDLMAQGYDQGDKVVVAVGGRIPGTNQVFECYSPPFVLPPINLHPPK